MKITLPDDLSECMFTSPGTVLELATEMAQ